MNKQLITTGFLALATLLLTGCTVIEGSGNIATETRAVSDFTRIELAGSGQVILTQGAEESVQVEADDNLMERIETEVRGHTLYLSLKQMDQGEFIRPSREIKYYVSFKTVEALTVAGSGTLEAQTIEAEDLALTIDGSGDIEVGNMTAADLKFTINGSGDVVIDDLTAKTARGEIRGSGNGKLAGEIETQVITIAGSGGYSASKLQSETVAATIAGSGDVTVWATEGLEANIAGSGNVYYYGTPKVSTHIAGSGEVQSRGEY